MASLFFQLVRLIYSAITLLMLPIFFARLWMKSLHQPAYRRHWRERLGWVKSPRAQSTIWIHCVSVGETRAATPLIQTLQSAYPNKHIHISSTTPTGRQMVAQIAGESVTQSYLPFDLTFLLTRAVHTIKPELIIVLETEIWPNLFTLCQRRHIPLLIANGRLSNRSFDRYKRLGFIGRRIFNCATHIMAQSSLDYKHYSQLQVQPERLTMTGNLKFDFPLDPTMHARAQQQRINWSLSNRPILIAGSTREHEEKIVINAFDALLDTHPTALLILVPRHPNRINEIERYCEQQSLSYIRRSKLCSNALIDQAILLVDTLGELSFFYAMSDICFVGGSLVNTGCQNVLEPAAFAKPILAGPSNYNFKQAYTWLHDAGALQTVHNAQQLAAAWDNLLSDSTQCNAMGGYAKTVYEAHQGATLKQFEIIQRYLS